MEQYEVRARQRQIDFHRQEVEEGPTRKPPMPEAQVAIHQRELELHLGMQATEAAMNGMVIPDNIIRGEE